MTEDEIIDGLRTSVKGALPSGSDTVAVTASTTIRDLGFDSLTILDLLYDIQQEFDVEFDAEEIVGFETVGDLITFLWSKGV